MSAAPDDLETIKASRDEWMEKCARLAKQHGILVKLLGTVARVHGLDALTICGCPQCGTRGHFVVSIAGVTCSVCAWFLPVRT